MRTGNFFSLVGLVGLLSAGCGGANTVTFPGGNDAGADGSAPATTMPGADGGGSGGGDGGGPSTYGADAGADGAPALACGAGEKSCGSACVTEDDPTHGCGGASCEPCALPDTAAVVCKEGACAIGTCPPGRADCDGVAANGCEVDTTSDPAHCGSCVQACGQSQVCSTGACGATCGSGLTDCSGACVDLTSNTSHCGACATTCTAPSGGMASCSGGKCSAACDTGYDLCGGSCVANGPAACGAACAVCPSPANGSATCTDSGTCGFDCTTGYTPCGSSCCASTNPTQPYSDGSRLKVIWLTTADGLQELVGWQDTVLSTQCSHVLAADGVLRCIPYSAASATGQEFADSACTQLVGAAPAAVGGCAATVPAYGEWEDTSNCSQPTHVYSIGAAVPALHYSKATGACAPYTGNGTYYAYGPEIAPSSFVGATTSYGTAVVGVAALMQTSTDGSSGELELDDVASKTECTFESTTDGQIRCIPETSAANNDPYYFADSQCADPLFYVYPATCGTTPAASVGFAFANTVSPLTCGDEIEVYALGTALANPPAAWSNASGTCVSGTPLSGPSAFYAGATLLPPSTYGAASTSAPIGSGRVQEIDEVVGPTTSTVRQQTGYYDSARSEDCNFTTAADGVLRCLPDGMDGGAFFQDSACTKPLAESPTGACGGTPKYISYTDETTCPVRTHVLGIGASFANTNTVYEVLNGVCTATTAGSYALYLYGAETAATSFAEGTVTIP